MPRDPYRVVGGRVVTPRGLEVSVVYHCNLSCRSCSHLSPLSARSLADVDRTLADVAVLGRHLRASFVKIIGGEPLLHPRLLDLTRGIAAAGIADSIRICTNGLLVRRLGPELLDLVDDIEISVYPGHEPDEAAMARLRALAREHGVRLEISSYGYFRESFALRGTAQPELVRRIYQTCKHVHVWRCTSLIDGHLFRCPQSAYLRRFGAMDGEWSSEGLPIRDTPEFAASLLAFLNGSEPLAACTRCLGSAGRLVRHAQQPRAGWLLPQERAAEELVDLPFLGALELEPGLDEGCVTSVERHDPVHGRSVETMPAVRALPM